MEGVKYIVEDKNCLLWGLAITTVGVENIEKGEEYPTKKHLKDYYFSTKEGRILQEYQMVLKTVDIRSPKTGISVHYSYSLLMAMQIY